MVAREDNDSVLVEVAVLKQLDKFANLVINEAARSKVCAAGTNLGFIRYRVVPKIDGLHEALGVLILVFLGNLHLGQGNLNAFVAVPVLLDHCIRIMRVGERDC
jgi:hypothetical protein